MELILGSLAFALMMAGQLLAVVAVHNARYQDRSAERVDTSDRARTSHIWLFGG